MNKIKIILVGAVLMTATTIMCYGQFYPSTSSSSGLLGTIMKYMDPTLLANLNTAYAANQNSANPMNPEGFLLEYITAHDDYNQAFNAAVEKAKEKEGLTMDSEVAKRLLADVSDLKKQIMSNTKISEEERAAIIAELEKYKKALNDMASQLTNPNSGSGGGGGGGGTPPQMQDPLQMIMQILQMLQQMCSGGGCKK